MNVLDLPGDPDARARGDLAERMVPVACELACMVRDESRVEVGALLARYDADELRALLVVLAGMVPVDVPASELLGWCRYDEFGRPLDRPLAPCGTYGAYRRHKQRGELVDDDCEHAAREYWQERNRIRKIAAVKEAGCDGCAA